MGSEVDSNLNDIVLLAEDDRTLSMVLRFMLEKNGYAVRAAATGAEAMSVALSERPRIAFLDMWMPEMTGLEVCRTIRQQSCLAGMTLVLMTGDDDVELESRALDAGVTAFLVKPFESERMQVLIEKAFDLRAPMPTAAGSSIEAKA